MQNGHPQMLLILCIVFLRKVITYYCFISQHVDLVFFHCLNAIKRALSVMCARLSLPFISSSLYVGLLSDFTIRFFSFSGLSSLHIKTGFYWRRLKFRPHLCTSQKQNVCTWHYIFCVLTLLSKVKHQITEVYSL